MGSSSPARLQLTLTIQHNTRNTPTMDPSRVWYDIPITRINEPTGNTKRVRWSDKLTQVKTISPRYKANPFSWPQPQQKTCNHFVCTAASPVKCSGNTASRRTKDWLSTTPTLIPSTAHRSSRKLSSKLSTTTTTTTGSQTK